MYFGSDKAREDIKKAFEEHKGEPIPTYSEEALRLSGLPELFENSLFNFFIEEHDLTLLGGQLDDIKNEVYKTIEGDLVSFPADKLDNLFHAVIKEMNRRKAQEQKVDVGFWSSEGEYKEDIQTLTPEEASEIFPKANSLKGKIKELAVFHCGVCPQNTGSCDGCCVDYLREKSKAILEEFFGMEAK